jgi:16S rRNA (uracil1498-N3)-methyltransferase
MQRFHCNIKFITQDKINISDQEQIHYLKDVLRLKTGDAVVIFDEKGNEYQARIEKLSVQAIILQIKKACLPAGRQGRSVDAKKIMITVACAIPKKSKIDDIIDKLTQLGVDRIIPLLTERVIVKLDKEKKSRSQSRWEKIAVAGSQQSQRNTITVIEPVKDFREVLVESRGYDLKLIPTLIEERKDLKEILADAHPKSILILIGPEGDFSPQEVSAAVSAGFIPVTFGELVLRVETACVYIASVLNYAFRQVVG